MEILEPEYEPEDKVCVCCDRYYDSNIFPFWYPWFDLDEREPCCSVDCRDEHTWENEEEPLEEMQELLESEQKGDLSEELTKCLRLYELRRSEWLEERQKQIKKMEEVSNERRANKKVF